jgi:hypothetical protein
LQNHPACTRLSVGIFEEVVGATAPLTLGCFHGVLRFDLLPQRLVDYGAPPGRQLLPSTERALVVVELGVSLSALGAHVVAARKRVRFAQQVHANGATQIFKLQHLKGWTRFAATSSIGTAVATVAVDVAVVARKPPTTASTAAAPIEQP